MELESLTQSYLFAKGALMDFPNANDFLEEFGIEPVEVDPGLSLYRYIKNLIAVIWRLIFLSAL